MMMMPKKVPFQTFDPMNRIDLFCFHRALTAMVALLAAHTISAQIVLEFGDPVTLAPISSFEFEPHEMRMIGIVADNTGDSARLSGYTLELGIGGGGVELGGVAGPTFTAADLVTGTVFATDHGTPTVNGGPNPFPGRGNVPQYLGLSLTTSSSAISPETLGAVDLAPGRTLLGLVTVSASGFSTPQTWDLQFIGPGSATFLNDAYNNILTPELQNGTITVVPEPGAYALAVGLALVGLTLWRRGIRFIAQP